ncbi:MAG: deoxyribodipyrimidine photo-lyase [Candidatus Eremiobacteraeota bacterium]|nr:deoxyribodipyrimidine photo-lyase [Candidatus Eremiobacteraeota bacterium]MBV9698508.1 deoxyribodipyrimidine photo-lyase [Candidatus Eremiobacteraeota bacterium]
MAGRPFIYRFRNDLRLDDHAGLTVAAARGAVVPLLVIDDALSARLRRSPRRAAYFCGAAANLDADLREHGSRLVVRRGALESEVLRFAQESDAAGVAWSAAYDADGMESDRSLRAALEDLGYAACIVHDAPVIPPEDIATVRGDDSRGYRAFAPYFEAWTARRVKSYESPLLLQFARLQIESQLLPEAGEFGSSRPADAAGARRAQHDFDEFLDLRAVEYAARSRVPSADGTSRLSAHLSFGALSARSVVRAAAERLANPLAIGEQRRSLRLYLRSLARRDFFAQLSWFNPQTAREALQGKMQGFPWSRSHPMLDSWRAGTTGFPLVDAGIRQLHETGWMHPHVRSVAASLLCFDLGVDWRIGQQEWDRWLIEDDDAAATGNWQWIAGVGADMAQFPRIYNPERQRRRFDPDAIYVRRWVEELRHIPVEAWRGAGGDSRQLTLALFADRSYPAPIVDHGRAARHFLRRYREFVEREN